MYVGQAVNILARVAQHLTDGEKAFDAYSFVECAFDQLDKLESQFIARLKPAWNRCWYAKRVRAGKAGKTRIKTTRRQASKIKPDARTISVFDRGNRRTIQSADEDEAGRRACCTRT